MIFLHRCIYSHWQQCHPVVAYHLPASPRFQSHFTSSHNSEYDPHRWTRTISNCFIWSGGLWRVTMHSVLNCNDLQFEGKHWDKNVFVNHFILFRKSGNKDKWTLFLVRFYFRSLALHCITVGFKFQTLIRVKTYMGGYSLGSWRSKIFTLSTSLNYILFYLSLLFVSYIYLYFY